jgi:hypothetical protein
LKQFDSIECLDLHSLPLEWKVLEHQLLIDRYDCCAVGVGKFVYVMGSRDLRRCISSFDLVEILDTEMTGLISEGSSLSMPQFAVGAALVDNTIWVVGGCNNNDGVLDTVESIMIDQVTGRLLESSWMQCPARMSKLQGWHLSVAPIGQCLVVVGGSGFVQASLVEIFNTERQE